VYFLNLITAFRFLKSQGVLVSKMVIVSNHELFSGILFIDSFKVFPPFENTFLTFSVANLLNAFTIFFLGFFNAKSIAFLAANLGEVNKETKVLALVKAFVTLFKKVLVSLNTSFACLAVSLNTFSELLRVDNISLDVSLNLK
jgi:hypothetical protein